MGRETLAFLLFILAALLANAVVTANFAMVCDMRAVPPYRIPQRGTARFRVSELPLLEGDYLVNLGIGSDPRHFYDSIPGALSFSVEKSDPHATGFVLTREHGICAFKASYEVFSPFEERRHSGSRTLEGPSGYTSD